MGELSGLVLAGTLCQYCGDYIGGIVGYPQSCKQCKKDEQNKESKDE